jgi:hypothetical protein
MAFMLYRRALTVCSLFGAPRACARLLSAAASASDAASVSASRALAAGVAGSSGAPLREAPPTHFPQMSVTLVRRVTARLPYNHFLFRVDPKYTKSDIREYLTKVYGVNVARITTSISLGAAASLHVTTRNDCPANPPPRPRPCLPRAGKTRRASGRRAKFYKLRDYKRALVILRDDKTAIAAPVAAQSSMR